MQKFLDKAMADVELAGRPAVPEQLLATAQAALVAKGMEGWTCPPQFPIVNLIARTIKLASVANGIMLDIGDSPEQMQPKVAIRRSIRAFNAGTWNSICQAARTLDLDEMIEEVDKAVDRAVRMKRARRGSRSTKNPTTPRRFIIEKEKDDDEARISVADNARLSEYLRRKALNEITIDEANLSLNCVGSFIDNLYPGGTDVRHVKMSNELRNYFPAIRRELCGEEACLYSFPEVALVRLMTMRLSRQDGFMMDVFGLTLVKDISLAHNTARVVQLHGKDVDVRKPRNDQWWPIACMESLRHAMDGVSITAQRLLHLSLLSHIEIRQLVSYNENMMR